MPAIISFSKYFAENAEYLASQTGMPVAFALKPNEVYHVFSAHDAASQLLEFQKKYGTSYIIYHSENIESVFFKNRDYIKLMRKNKVLHYSPMIAAICTSWHKVECAGFFAFDYAPMAFDAAAARPIDILFFGAMSQPRYDILREIQNTRPDLRLTVTTDAFGADLDKLLLASKCVINISFYERNALETHRINKAMAAGCKVISNESADEQMNAKYRGLIEFCKRDLCWFIGAVNKAFPL